MELWVDAAAGTVESEGASWPLTVDGCTGGATIVVDGAAFRLRPLRWGEKQRLARFAAHGERLLSREVVAVALASGTEPDPSRCELLAGVVAWLDDPRAARPTALPLQADVLAAAALELLRATGLRPDDLDHRDAAEVEALWRAARAEAATAVEPTRTAGGAAPVDEWAGATMIRIAPDSDGDGDRPSSAPASDPRHAEPGPARAIGSAEPPARPTATAGPVPPRAGGDVGPTPPDPRQPRPADPPPAPASPMSRAELNRGGRTLRPDFEGAASEVGPTDGRRARRRGRIVGPVPVRPHADPDMRDDAPLTWPPAWCAPAAVAPAAAGRPDTRPWPTDLQPPTSAHKLLEHAWPDIPAPASGAAGSQLASESRSMSAATVIDAALVDAALVDTALVDALVDALTEGLEEAAIDAGIEV